MTRFYVVKVEELSTIVGGNNQGNAFIGTLGGATEGIKVCKQFGPWVTTGCGIVGAGAGAWIGYHNS